MLSFSATAASSYRTWRETPRVPLFEHPASAQSLGCSQDGDLDPFRAPEFQLCCRAQRLSANHAKTANPPAERPPPRCRQCPHVPSGAATIPPNANIPGPASTRLGDDLEPVLPTPASGRPRQYPTDRPVSTSAPARQDTNRRCRSMERNLGSQSHQRTPRRKVTTVRPHESETLRPRGPHPGPGADSPSR